MIIGFN
ncbi:hypothetical protein YPPY53_0870, partial [Yersinia pestis PY-53]